MRLWAATCKGQPQGFKGHKGDRVFEADQVVDVHPAALSQVAPEVPEIGPLTLVGILVDLGPGCAIPVRDPRRAG
jgi:hypothetical protein